MSVTAERIDSVIATDLAVRLKAQGYRKRGRTFFRQAADHTRVVNVQGNKWNNKDEGSFAINLGVYFPVVAELGGGPIARGAFPKEYESSIRVRLGPHVEHRGDYWWTLSTDRGDAALAAAIGKAWDEVGTPWFERAATLAGAYAIFCQELLHFPAAIFALAQGDRVKAAGHLSVAIERLPRRRARLEEWGRRHGLLEPS